MDDMKLVREYVSNGSEEAFAELVSRHINMVYSVARRHVGNPDSAKEITQAVFIILANKSRSLSRETILSGWLFQTTRLTAANFVRSETRRLRREQGACMESNLRDEGDNAWKQIAPFLDDAVASLEEKDRNAVILRFIEGRSLSEVGNSLGASEAAAKKRVSRAVEKLRLFFSRRGVTLSGAIITGCIVAKSAEAVPVGLANAVTATALKGTVLTTSTATLVKGTLKIMAWTKLKMGIIMGMVAMVIATQSYKISNQNKQLASLREQVAVQPIKPEIAPPPPASPELGELRVKAANLSNEVLRLRAQLASTKRPDSQLSQTELKLNSDTPRENTGRDVGLAIAQGDPTALERLQAMAQAEHRDFNSNSVAMNDTDRSELAARTFAPLREAFDVITEAAAKGNQAALQAISHAVMLPVLQGYAVHAIGTLAGNGDEAALQVLLNAKDYAISQSSAIGALKPAADNGNQKAITALSAVAADQSQSPLWYMAAEGLGNAAASGNPIAVDALIAMSGQTNQSIQSVVTMGLQRAASNGNTKAADALGKLRNH